MTDHDAPADQTAPPPGSGPPDHPGSASHGAQMFGPINFGQLLGRSFVLLTQNPVPLLAVAAPISLVLLISVSLLAEAVPFSGAPDPFLLILNRHQNTTVSGLGLVLVTTLATFVIALLAQVITQGFALFNLRAALLGERARSATLWRLLGGAWARLFGLGLISLGIGAAYVVVVGGLTGLATLLLSTVSIGSAGLYIIVPIAILLVIGSLVPLSWLVTQISLAASAVVFEGATVRAALRRSWQLVTGRFWRVLGAQALVSLSFAAATWVFFMVLLFTLLAFTDPSASASAFAMTLIFTLPTNFLAVGATLTAANAVGLLYVDARLRTDWLGITLNGYAAARIGGTPPARLADPFVTPPAPPSHSVPQTPPAAGPPPGSPPPPTPAPPAPPAGV
ncbi:hypothetical protein [Leucobacter luti]|uniref:Glycerophosphoryl diester phosphodiesterase family protein n=1 Tax=Leucobacter luti TaxID=340320 RepID=A0A4Q7U149_9MICO|nr:hypothetical protein [Leucobacter luti]MBL3698707.1 hypothetical protein [Leucobacter luti]RZT66082.1 hypothetical protein EV139_1508 [Leucobacter luti]